MNQQGSNALDSIYCVTTMVVAPSPTLIRLQGIELQPCVGAHLLLCNRSAALLQLGRSNEALADAVKALELSPPTFAKASHWERAFVRSWWCSTCLAALHICALSFLILLLLALWNHVPCAIAALAHLACSGLDPCG